MKLNARISVLAAGLALACAQAGAVTLTFSDLADDTVLGSQYAGLGVVFTANAFSGVGGPTGDWASNSSLLVSATDIGALGAPALVSGTVVRSYGGWLAEDGDPSFLATFSAPVSFFSADFAGLGVPADTRIMAYDGSTLLGTVSGSCTATVTEPCQQTLSFSAASITSVAVVPGNFNDWVAVDNITFTPAAAVPEASTYAMMGLGLAVLAFQRRRRA